MDEKRFRFDLFIALCALLISSVAAAASVYQTRVIGEQTSIISRQLSASTWPYLSFVSSYSRKYVELDLRNDGLGPAIIRAVTITTDGKPVAPDKNDSAIDA